MAHKRGACDCLNCKNRDEELFFAMMAKEFSPFEVGSLHNLMLQTPANMATYSFEAVESGFVQEGDAFDG